MSNGAQDWMSAARCHDVSRTEPGFSALPPRYQRDVLCMGLMALGTIAFAAGAVLLAKPLPSRTLASAAPLPHGAAGRGRLVETSSFRAAPPPIALGPRRQIRASGTSLDLASVGPAAVDPAPRRRSIFSRFFRGVWRSVQPVGVKADATH